MTARVVGIGHAEVDHLAVVDRITGLDSRTELASFSVQGGGTVANAMVALSTLQVPTRFVGCVSDDDFGGLIRRGLEASSVDVAHVKIQPERLSPYKFVLIERESLRQSIYYTMGSVDPLTASDVRPEWIEGGDLLVVDGYHVEAQIRAAELARNRGIIVVLDAGRLTEGMGELVALSDVMIASERYASEVAPRGEIEDSLIELYRMGPGVVVVTMGDDGSIGLEGEKLVRQPPLQVAAVDTTGAGDAYLGGYCYGLLHHWPLERCMQIASAVAGLSCRELGARAALPDVEEVEAVSWQEIHS